MLFSPWIKLPSQLTYHCRILVSHESLLLLLAPHPLEITIPLPQNNYFYLKPAVDAKPRDTDDLKRKGNVLSKLRFLSFQTLDFSLVQTLDFSLVQTLDFSLVRETQPRNS